MRWRYAVIEFTGSVDVYSDSDWAADERTRKSMSGGLLLYEGCAIKTWAKLQGMIAPSSAEAEYIAMMKGVQEALALRTMLLEMGLECNITVHTDSSAAKASMEKPGLMHMKHMQLRELFLKKIVQQGLVTIKKLHTSVNPADCLTKAVTKSTLDRFWQQTVGSFERAFEKNVDIMLPG